MLTMRSGGLAAALHSECTRALWSMDDKYFSNKKKEFCNYMETSGLFGTLDYVSYWCLMATVWKPFWLHFFQYLQSSKQKERGALRLLLYHHGFESDVIVMFQIEKLNELRADLRLWGVWDSWRGDGVHVVHCKASPTIRRNSLCLSRTILRWIFLHKNLALFLHSRVFFLKPVIFRFDTTSSTQSVVYAQVVVECDTTDLRGTRRNTYREMPSSSLTHSLWSRYSFLFGSQVPHIYQYAIPRNVTMTLPIECDWNNKVKWINNYITTPQKKKKNKE